MRFTTAGPGDVLPAPYGHPNDPSTEEWLGDDEEEIAETIRLALEYAKDAQAAVDQRDIETAVKWLNEIRGVVGDA